MDLGNGKLSTAARIANEMVHTHAKELRTTKETTSHAIAKMKAMRAHAHGFAELMLEHAASDKAPDHIACWTAFSGLLDDGAIDSADWAGKKKKQPASSHSVYDIAMFDKFTGSATMHSPAPHVAYQLTATKVKVVLALPSPGRWPSSRGEETRQWGRELCLSLSYSGG